MKYFYLLGLTMLVVLLSPESFSQTNTFPASGNVGIGTSTPTEKLVVVGNIKLPNYSFQEFHIGNTKGYIWGNHDYSGTAGSFHDDLVLSANWQGVSSNTDNIVNSSSFLRNAAISLGRHGIRFYTSDISTAPPSERISVTPEGNVGIGTTSPRSRFEVNGDIRIPASGGKIVFGYGSPGSEDDFLLLQDAGSPAPIFKIQQDGVTKFSIIGVSGNVLVGKSTQVNTNYKLDVAGFIRADEVVVNTTGADFVFKPDYKLPGLSDIEEFIKQNGHLPDIAPSSEMQEKGMNMSEMQTKLLQKIEELTLYVIELKKENEKQNKEIQSLRKIPDDSKY